MNQHEELIAPKVAADRLGVRPETVRRWIREGRVPAYRLGRKFTRVDWEDLLRTLAEAQSTEDGAQRELQGGAT